MPVSEEVAALIEACERLILALTIAGLQADPSVAFARAAIERARA